jgi:hypothetical protein
MQLMLCVLFVGIPFIVGGHWGIAGRHGEKHAM